MGSVRGVSQLSFPNMTTMHPGIFPTMLGMIPGIRPGANGGAMLPGLGAAFGEVCRDYLNGRCGSNDCKLNHPLHNQLMAALSAGSTMGAPGQMPMGPSAAAAELSGLWFPPLLIQQKQLMIRRSDCSRSTEPPPLRVLERLGLFGGL